MPKLELLATIPGVERRTAESMVAEMGTDMSRFGSSARLASWAGRCPGNHESSGKSKSGRARKGNKWLGATLTESAMAAARTKDTYLAAQYARLKGRRGHAKAIRAVSHSTIVAAYHVLERDVPDYDLGADWFVKRRPDAHAKRLARQIELLGHKVELTPADKAA